MKLPGREQRTLADLERDLTACDPALAALFARSFVTRPTFTDPALAALYDRLFPHPRRSRHLRLLRKMGERRRTDAS